MPALHLHRFALTAAALVLLATFFAPFAASQTFGTPSPAPQFDGHPSRGYGGVPGAVYGGVPGNPYDGLRVDGYPSNRNLNLDDRSPRLGPAVPDRRESAPLPHSRPGAAAPGWGGLHQQPAQRGEAAPQRRY